MKYERRILVTGGCGFVGSHVVIRLVKKYPTYQIVNFDCMDYCASHEHLREIENAENYKFVKGNILSLDLVTYVLRNEEIDTVMHFAAQSHVDNSFGNSLTFTENNVLGTHALLEASRVANVDLFIHVSTDEVYGEYSECAHEEKVLDPTNPYAASKAAAEFIVKTYARSFGLNTIITRGNNVYGPHQFPEKIIPKFILRLLRGLPCCVHGDGSNSRNYIYVEDTAAAFDVILHKGQSGGIYNLGTPLELTNLEVARAIIRHLGLQEKMDELIVFVEDRKINDKRYSTARNRMEELGWSASTSWEDGLRKTVDWYKEHGISRWGGALEALSPHPGHTSAFTVCNTNLIV